MVTLRTAAGLLLVAAALATARAGDDGARAVTGFGDDPEPWADTPPDAALAGADDAADVPSGLSPLRETARAMRRFRWQATVTAVRIPRAGTAAAGVVASRNPILAAADLAALRQAIRDRDATVERCLAAAGACGDIVACGDGGTVEAPIVAEGGSAVGAAATWTRTGTAERGVAARLTVVPSGDGRWRVRVALRWCDAAAIDRVSWIDDRVLDRVRVPLFAAESTFDARPGETVALRAVESTGDARIVLVRVEGDAPDVGFAQFLDGGTWVATPTAGAEAWSDAEWPTDDGPPGREERLRNVTAVLAPPRSRVNWSDTEVGCFREGRIVGGENEDVRRALALRRGTGSVEAARFAGARLVLPAAPGTLFRGFLGVLETRFDGVEAWPACETCLVVKERVVRDATGFGVAGGAWPDGTVDADVASRDVVAERTFAATGRRDLAGHVKGAPLVLRLPMRRVRETAVGGSVSPLDPRLGSGTTLRYEPPPEARADVDPWRDAAPVPVRVGGAALSLRPGCHATLVERTLHPFVRRWAAEGFCGMRARFPVVDAVAEGTDVALALAEDAATIDVAAEVRGAPERLATLDPGDGAVDVVRSPYLRFAARELVPPADGRIAAAGSLALRVVVGPGTRPAAPRTAARTALRVGDATCLADAPTDVVLESGGETSLATDVSYYDSNHMTGEVRTEVHLVRDGVRAVLGAPAGGVRALSVESRTRPSWTQRALRIATLPARDGETHLALAEPRRAVRTGRFSVSGAEGFRREPASEGDLPRIAVGPQDERGDER